MHMKKVLSIAAVTVLLSVPALSTTNANAAGFKNETRNITLNRPVTSREVYQNPKGDYLNKVVGTHTFPAGDHVHVYTQGTNGIDTNISDANNGYGKHLIEDSIDTTPNKLASENSTTNQNNSNTNPRNSNNGSTHSPSINSNNSSSNVANSSDSNNSSNNKLAQTGESNTDIKAGIVGAIAAMVSGVFAGVSKFIKRA